MCLCCLLVLDLMLLCRSIYLCGIPLGGLPTIFYRQSARQVGVCVLFSCRTRWFFPQALRPSHSPVRSLWSDRSPGSSMLTETERSSSRCRSILRRPHQHLQQQVRSQNCLRDRLHQQLAACSPATRGSRSTTMIWSRPLIRLARSSLIVSPS